MTLVELSASWNELRNAALGRGTRPLVSAGLAERVGREYELFREWSHSGLWGLGMSGYGSVAVERFNALRAAVAAELGEDAVPARAEGPAAAAERAVSDAARGLGAAACFALALALLIAIGGGRDAG